jgi:D-glycerate 3-kinase
LAQQVHPLLGTRGVPGTHATDLLMATVAQLRAPRAGQPVTWPRFDKASDDRLPSRAWRTWVGPVDVVLFEGWCVGARAQPEAELLVAVNALEQEEDRDARFRRHVNAQLAGPYRELFAQLAGLVFLAAPDMEAVLAWRTQQERELAAAALPGSPHVMGGAGLARFVQHFERVTRWMLVDTPARAQVVLELGRDHSCKAVKIRT